MRKDVGRKNTLFVHVTWLPYLAASKELKTKPTQHGVRELRSIGIQPDVIALRSDHPVDEDVLAKTQPLLRRRKEAVIPLITADTIYAVPISLEESGLGDWIVNEMQLPVTLDREGLPNGAPSSTTSAGKPALHIGLVGKYIELEDAYFSVKALIHAGLTAGWDVNIEWISSEELGAARSGQARPIDTASSCRAVSAIAASRARLSPHTAPACTTSLPRPLPRHAGHVHRSARDIFDSESRTAPFDISTEYPLST